MRAETYIARRLYFEQAQHHSRETAARPAVRVALAGIAIGLMVMIVTVCVVVGFKRTITDKVAGFGAHISVVNFENNNTYEFQPVTVTDSLIERLGAIDNVAAAHRFYTKPGIIKTDDAFQGIVLKGTDYWNYFSASLTEGRLPEDEREVLISTEQSRLLGLRVGDSFLCYFVDESVRVRKLSISGLYSTGLGEFDCLFVTGLPSLVQRLNGWETLQCSGVEILVQDLNRLEETADRVYFATANRLDEEGNSFYTQTLEQLNPAIFAWLDLLDMNVVVIIVLMLAVSMFSIISALIILILDSISLIGTLKALGANNRFVRRIFITEAALLIGKGLLWGNMIGLTLCAIQYMTHVLPLDSATYYVNFVPMAFPWGWIVLLNIGTLALSLLILLAPSAIVTRISPARVMRFE